MMHASGRAVALTPIVVLGSVAIALAGNIDTVSARVGLELGVVCATVIAAARATWLWDMAREAAQAHTQDGTKAGRGRTVVVGDRRRPIVDRESGLDRRRPIVDRESGLYVRWYFLLRLEEEIARGARFGQRFTVVRLSGVGSVRDRVIQGLAHSLRTVDYAGDLGGPIAVVLPNTDAAGAQIWRKQRFAVPLAPSDVRCFEYPVDGKTVSELLGEDEWDTSRYVAA